LLTETGIPFTRMIPNLEETINPGEAPYQYAARLAEDKATLVGRRATDRQVVIGCDTIVVMNGRILGKPRDKSDAFDILTSLSGNMHVVCSALALFAKGNICASGYELTRVYFRSADPESIRAYIATGEPMDKAGAYGIQGKGAFLVDSISGSLDNVIGLPRQLLERLARKALQEI
jgi:septum formation protein